VVAPCLSGSKICTKPRATHTAEHHPPPSLPRLTGHRLTSDNRRSQHVRCGPHRRAASPRARSRLASLAMCVCTGKKKCSPVGALARHSCRQAGRQAGRQGDWDCVLEWPGCFAMCARRVFAGIIPLAACWGRDLPCRRALGLCLVLGPDICC
jgi:hypothetical protein